MVKKTQGETLYDRVISRLDSSDNVSSSSDTHSIQEPLYTRKFIVIQSGCDTFCTFCLTIHKRGSNRNRPAQEIIDEINAFVEQGGKEIILT